MLDIIIKDDNCDQQLLNTNFLYSSLDERDGKYVLSNGNRLLSFKAYVKDNGRKVQIYFLFQQEQVMQSLDCVAEI